MSSVNDRIERAAEAKAVLNSRAFKDAIEEVKTECVTSLLSVSPGSPEAIKFHSLLIAVNDVENRLKSTANDEKFLKKQGHL